MPPSRTYAGSLPPSSSPTDLKAPSGRSAASLAFFSTRMPFADAARKGHKADTRIRDELVHLLERTVDRLAQVGGRPAFSRISQRRSEVHGVCGDGFRRTEFPPRGRAGGC